jgi:hypothetical protein
MKLDPKTQEKLHEKLASQLLELFDRPPCEHCGFTTVNAKDLTVVRQFLADNGTTADLHNRAPIRQLTDNLPTFEDPEDKITKPGKRSA